MTREEAIEFIAQSVKSDVDMAKVADAIKALEQVSTTKNDLGVDCMSRQFQEIVVEYPPEDLCTYPEYKTIGGYIKVFTVTAENKQKWWDELSNEDKQAVMSLPNFDVDKFYQCTEIRINSEVQE